MEIVFLKKIAYIHSYKYSRFIDPDTHLMVSLNDIISDDTVISKGHISKMSYRIKVSDFSTNFVKYVLVENGEIVHKGDPIIKKRKKQIEAPVDGIVDLSHLPSGFILVKSYPEDIVNISKISGTVSYISDDKSRVVIDSPVLKIDLRYIFGPSTEANFRYLCDNKGFLNLENINASVIGDIIYVGNLITMEIIKKSVAVGVVGIMGNGIELRNNESIEDFVNSIPITVGVTDGFGVIENSCFYSLEKNHKSPAFIDQSNMAFVISDNKSKRDDKLFDIKKVEVSDKVQIFSYPYWGYTGRVNSINSIGKECNINLDNGNNVNIQIDDIVGIIED